jgi:hypothetical protein
MKFWENLTTIAMRWKVWTVLWFYQCQALLWLCKMRKVLKIILTYCLSTRIIILILRVYFNIIDESIKTNPFPTYDNIWHTKNALTVVHQHTVNKTLHIFLIIHHYWLLQQSTECFDWHLLPSGMNNSNSLKKQMIICKGDSAVQRYLNLPDILAQTILTMLHLKRVNEVHIKTVEYNYLSRMNNWW